MQILFKECQRFRQVWLWVLLTGINGLFIFIFYQQIILGSPVGNHPISDGFLFVSIVFDLAITCLVFFMRLETAIKPDGIYYCFFPIQFKAKKISWNRISKAYVRQYNPLKEYGGWGLRGSLRGNSSAYNVSGNMGLQLVYDNGKLFLLGTKKPGELKKVLKELGRFSGE